MHEAWGFENIFATPPTILVEYSSQHFTIFALVNTSANDKWQYHLVFFIGIDDEDWLIFISFSSSQAEQHILIFMTTLHIWIIRRVIYILILQFDNLESPFLHIYVWLYNNYLNLDPWNSYNIQTIKIMFLFYPSPFHIHYPFCSLFYFIKFNLLQFLGQKNNWIYLVLLKSIKLLVFYLMS